MYGRGEVGVVVVVQTDEAARGSRVLIASKREQDNRKISDYRWTGKSDGTHSYSLIRIMRTNSSMDGKKKIKNCIHGQSAWLLHRRFVIL